VPIHSSLTIIAAVAASVSLHPGFEADTSLRLGDRVINARCVGYGSPAALLLHGARSSIRIWDRVFEAWSGPGRLCAFDRSGHGRSTPSPLDRDWTDLAAAIHTVRRALGITGAWVAVGHSLGGLYARALLHGEEPPVAVVLVDPAHEAMRPRLRGLVPDSSWSAWGDELSRNGDGINELSLGEWLSGRQRPDVPVAVLSASRRRFPPGWDSAQAAMVARDLHRSLATGSRDTLIVATNSGHNVPIDEPTLVARAVERAMALTESSRTGQQGGEDRTITLPDGTKLRLTEFGRGPLLLVLHGGPSLGRRYLVDGLRPLGGSHRVVVYDQRGAGESEFGPRPGFAYSQLLDDVSAVATALGEDRFVLLGHSWGATLALSYTLRHSARVQRLILVSPTEPGQRFATLQARRLAANTTAADSIALRAALTASSFVDGTVAGTDSAFRAMYRPWFGDRDSVVNLRAGLTRTQVNAARAMGQAVSRRSEGTARWSDLARVAVPTLLIHGDADPIPPDISVEMARVLPNAELAVLTGVGHFHMLERPGDLIRHVRRFSDAPFRRP
jgi:proline iminopeptidase